MKFNLFDYLQEPKISFNRMYSILMIQFQYFKSISPTITRLLITFQFLTIFINIFPNNIFLFFLAEFFNLLFMIILLKNKNTMY